MKIVEAISDGNIGGAGILLISRLKHSDTERHHYHVILPEESALRERLKTIPVRVWTIRGGMDRSFSWRALFQYLSLLRQIRPDLVNCHGNLSCRIAATLCGIPCRLYTRHCAYDVPMWQTQFPGKWLIGWIQKILSTHVIAVAHAARENLLQMGVPASRISVIINGSEALPGLSDTEKQGLLDRLKIPQDTTVVGICARLEPCKDHRTFLQAAEELLRRSKQYRFLIIGDGSLATSLKEWCCVHGIDRYVIFTGFVKDVSPYLNIMDLNVNCSVGTETSSLALSEGMSLGLPAVVSDYGGNPYMVRHGENGLVWRRSNAKELADAIERIANDRELYQIMSQNAHRRFDEELNVCQMTQKTEKLYEELFRFVKSSRSV